MNEYQYNFKSTLNSKKAFSKRNHLSLIYICCIFKDTIMLEVVTSRLEGKVC